MNCGSRVALTRGASRPCRTKPARRAKRTVAACSDPQDCGTTISVGARTMAADTVRNSTRGSQNPCVRGYCAAAGFPVGEYARPSSGIERRQVAPGRTLWQPGANRFQASGPPSPPAGARGRERVKTGTLTAGQSITRRSSAGTMWQNDIMPQTGKSRSPPTAGFCCVCNGVC